MTGGKNEEMKIKEKKEEFESLIQSWNGSEMWFQERHLQFPGRVEVTTNDWGVSIIIISEYFRKLRDYKKKLWFTEEGSLTFLH